MKIDIQGKAILAAAGTIFGFAMYRAYQTRLVHAEHFDDSTKTLVTPGMPIPHYFPERQQINKRGPVIVPPHPSEATTHKDSKVALDQYLPSAISPENIQEDLKMAKTYVQDMKKSVTTTTLPEKIDYGKERMDTMMDRNKARVDTVMDKTKQTVENIEAKVEQGTTMVKDTVAKGKEKVENVVEEGKETMEDVGKKIKTAVIPGSTTATTTKPSPAVTTTSPSSSTTPKTDRPLPKPLVPSSAPSSSSSSSTTTVPATVTIPDELIDDLEGIFKDSVRHKEYIEQQLAHIQSFNNKALSVNRLYSELEATLEDSRDHSVYVAENIQHFMDSIGKKVDTSRAPTAPSKGITGTISGYPPSRGSRSSSSPSFAVGSDAPPSSGKLQ